MRPNRSLSGLVIALLLIAPALFATDLQVEGPQDTLLGPPERPDVNHCTLRKAIGNANVDSAPYPQCAAGSGAYRMVTRLGMARAVEEVEPNGKASDAGLLPLDSEISGYLGWRHDEDWFQLLRRC